MGTIRPRHAKPDSRPLRPAAARLRRIRLAMVLAAVPAMAAGALLVALLGRNRAVALAPWQASATARFPELSQDAPVLAQSAPPSIATREPAASDSRPTAVALKAAT